MEAQPSREIRYDGVHCAFVIESPAPGVVVLRISGTDIGEFGDAPMRGLEQSLAGTGPVRLFIDAREVRGASLEVSGEWARWLADHRRALREIDMLTGSRFVEVTAGFVRRFSALEGVMRIYTEPAVFDAALAAAKAQP
jgi:hypothetical protein